MSCVVVFFDIYVQLFPHDPFKDECPEVISKVVHLRAVIIERVGDVRIEETPQAFNEIAVETPFINGLELFALLWGEQVCLRVFVVAHSVVC